MGNETARGRTISKNIAEVKQEAEQFRKPNNLGWTLKIPSMYPWKCLQISRDAFGKSALFQLF